MEPLRVVCYTDGRPGHEKQSRAVMSAMAALTPLSLTWLTLRHTVGIKRFFQGFRSILSADIESAPPPKFADLVIGTGATTHLPMVGLKMRTGAKLVTCMSPDPWLRPWFDLCLIPRHDQPAVRRKYFPTFGPPCLALDADQRDERKGLVLAGGVDAKSHYWDTDYFMAQIKRLTASPDMFWTVASSGRTPPDTIGQLRQLASTRHHLTFFSADETPRGWIESAYASHAQVWVTADSVSMVYEALTAGCRVGVLPVKWKRTDNKFQNGIDDLLAHGMLGDYEQWSNGAELPRVLKPLNEAERCAKEMMRRWWPERLR